MMPAKTTAGRWESGSRVFTLNRWYAILAAAVGFALYANTIKHAYTLDDVGAITGNPYVKQGISGIPAILKTGLWHFENANLGYYRPLSMITFAIENQFFPGNPHVSHLGNVILYAATGFFLCLLLLNLFKNLHPLFSFVTTLLFLAHPVHTEVVANIKSRDEILAFLNLVTAIYILLRAYRPKKISYAGVGVSCLFFYLALLSKETAMAGLLLAPLILHFHHSFTLKETLKKSIPFLAALLIFQFHKYKALGTLYGQVPYDIVNYPYTETGTKLPSTFLIFLHCLRLIVFPHPLTYDYSYNQIPAIEFNLTALFGFLLAIALVYFSLAGYFKKSVAGLGGMIFCIALAPALAFVYLRGGILAERFLYAPSLGFCITATWLLGFVVARKEGPVWQTDVLAQKNIYRLFPFILIAVIFTFYSVKTVTRNRVWHDNLILFSTDVKTSPNSAQVRRHLGSILIDSAFVQKDSLKRKEMIYEGIGQLKASLAIHPHFGDSYFKLGHVYQVQGNTDSAIYYYNRATEDAPQGAMSYNNLGVIYDNLGRADLASYYFNKALEANPYMKEAIANHEFHKKKTGLDLHTFPSALDPETAEKVAKNKDAMFYFKLGTLVLQKDSLHADLAAKYLQKAVQMDPKMEQAYLNLASAYGMGKKYNEALETLQKLLAINSRNVYAYMLMGVTYERMGDQKKAKEYYQKAKKLSGK